MIQKPLSCKLRKSDIHLDYKNIIIENTDEYEIEIKKMISIISDEIGEIWDGIWTWHDVIERFKKGHFLWLSLDDDSPIACSWCEVKSKEELYIYNTYLITKFRSDKMTFKELFLIRNNTFYDLGYRKTLCMTDNPRAEKALRKVGYVNDNWKNVHYLLWTSGYDSTFLLCDLILEGKVVQPIYIDDRVNHGGYHSNPLVKQRGGDTYPRKSTEMELERMDWLQEKIYDEIPNSKSLLLPYVIISEPIEEDEKISKVIEKYNEWLPNTISEKGWLPVYTDLMVRFQKQFGYDIYWGNDHIEGEFYEEVDCSIEDGIMDVDKLPSKYKDLKIFSGLVQPLRHTNKKKMLKVAKQKGFDDLLYYTWTCWYPNDREPCGECHVCRERIIESKEI